MNTDLVNIVFGLKVRQARTAAGLTLTEFAARCDLSPSYVTEIEKGRKYPKADKILKMAQVLGKEYDDLVSIKLAPSLAYLESALASPLLQEFPFEEFGLEVGNLVPLLTRAPAKASALIHAILEIGRRYDLKEEHFLRAAMRSYQELHDNYFQELEDAAVAFATRYALADALPIPLARLEALVRREFGYELDREELLRNQHLAAYRSVMVPGAPPRLLINARLTSNQLRFLLARELGYQFLGLTDRAYTSAPEQVDSFQQVFNDFKASYFAGALLMPRPGMIQALQHLFAQPTWQPDILSNMLTRYDVTPEMLLYRFSELIPQFFGMKLHFLRFHAQGEHYRLVKQLNMSRLLLPSGLALHEHFCRRWLTVRLLRELSLASRPGNGSGQSQLRVGAQMSQFYESGDRFLCLGFARPLVLSPDIASSVIVGLRVDADLRNDICFTDDPEIPFVIINETCERCPLTDEQCTWRAAPPTVVAESRRRADRQQALHELLAQLRA